MAGAQIATRKPRWAEFDPLRWLWRGLTSVRFALGIIAFLALATLIGVLIPQLPAEMRGNVAAEAAWYGLQDDKFGFLADLMRRLGFFSVFRSIWFVTGLALLVASICVCTANRLPPVYRNVVRPQTRVPDEYFSHDLAVVSIASPDTEALTDALRRRRYSVSLERDGDATYLFADRFPWAQFATFVSHLALILFLAGGLVTLVVSRQETVFVAEGEAGAAVFAPSDRDHMTIHVTDAVGTFDSAGRARDFRTYLTVYKNGSEVANGYTTVNKPLSAGGYRFHQAAYFPDGAALTVRDLRSGRVVYDEVLALSSQAATPRVVVRDAAGALLIDEAIVPTDFLGDVAGRRVMLPGGREFWIGGRPGANGAPWQLVVFETGTPTGTQAIIDEGKRLDIGGMSLTFTGVTSVPSSAVRIPGSDRDGVAELSETPNGPVLTVGPVQGRALALSTGQRVVLGDYEYVFGGKREFAGLTVRRDPGSTFIWVATGVFLLGLALTFYTPRRRLWGKISQGQAAFRGLGGRSQAIEREIREVAARLSTNR